ncbi:MAG: YhgE/Pip domain-containing protein [Atopobiaceae bacterium]|jgi:putative membrane protein|nr:YhgE/Pip domain-containing protein [Atopobiaceae bacterium]
MRTIWRLFRQDLAHATMNVIAIIVCVGLTIVPSLYAWFNIAGSWDPYANTGNLKVAVANVDAGYKSDLVPLRVSIGEQVVDALRGNDSFDWVVTDEDSAVEGVRSGDYYAALVIPSDFSANMMTSLTSDVRTGTLVYYTNEKSNAIAPIVTGKGADAVKEQIDETFAQTLADIGTNLVVSLADYLDGDQVTNFATTLDATLQRNSRNLRTTAADISSYSALAKSTQGLLESSRSLLDTTDGSVTRIQDSVSGSADSVRRLSQTASGVTEGIDAALSQSSSGFDQASQVVNDVYDAAGTGSSEAAEGLETLAGKVGDLSQRLSDLRSALESARQSSLLTTTQKDALATFEGRVDQATGELGDLATKLEAAEASIEGGSQSAEADRADVLSAIAAAKGDVASLQGDYEDDLKGQVASLADAIDQAAQDTRGVSADLETTVSSLEDASGSASGDLTRVGSSLDTAASQITSAADELDRVQTDLAAAISSGDVEQIRAMIGSDSSAVAEFLASPVGLERNAVFPVANNGSAMTPFYDALALWVGAIMLVAMLKVGVSDRQAEALPGARPRHLYLGRLGLFVVLALLQATLLCLGDLFYLGIQCTDPLLFLACGWVTSFVFMNIMYALTVSFGDVGKAIAVLLLVIQVAGSGGTFPAQMLPGFFQRLYPLLPFVHSMNAQRAAIAGVYENDCLLALLALLAFVVPSLLLGLALRKPVVRLNAWVARKLEDTRLM